MKAQVNVRIEHLSADEIEAMDQKFSNCGWVIRGVNDTPVSHSFRVYQWEQTGSEPIYPQGYEPRMEPIDLSNPGRSIPE